MAASRPARCVVPTDNRRSGNAPQIGENRAPLKEKPRGSLPRGEPAHGIHHLASDALAEDRFGCGGGEARTVGTAIETRRDTNAEQLLW